MNPFMVIEKPDDFSNSEYETLIEITPHSSIKYSFNTINLTDFLGNLTAEYPSLAHRAIRMILPFPSTNFSVGVPPKFKKLKRVPR